MLSPWFWGSCQFVASCSNALSFKPILSPRLPAAWTLLCPEAPGKADPSPTATTCSLYPVTRDLNLSGSWMLWGHLCLGLGAKRRCKEPASCEGVCGLVTAWLQSVSIEFYTAPFPFSRYFWLQLQPCANNAPCVHVSHLALRLVKHF